MHVQDMSWGSILPQRLPNDEIRHSLRYKAERYHRRRQEYFFDNCPLMLPLNPSSLDLQVELEQIQDIRTTLVMAAWGSIRIRICISSSGLCLGL